jgi:hypothetical protein
MGQVVLTAGSTLSRSTLIDARTMSIVVERAAGDPAWERAKQEIGR